MVRVDVLPLLGGRGAVNLLVDEITALAVVADSLFGEGMAGFGLVGSIVFHVDPQFLRSVGELALLTIGTEPLFSIIFAERGLGLVSRASREGPECEWKHIYSPLILITFSGSLAVEVEGGMFAVGVCLGASKVHCHGNMIIGIFASKN